MDAVIELTYRFSAPPGAVFHALTDPVAAESWSGSAATTGDGEGAPLSLWDGVVTGQNAAVDPPHRLVQRWAYEGWPNPSEVTFELAEATGGTTLNLRQVGLPEGVVSEFEQGWIDNYFEPIAAYLAR